MLVMALRVEKALIIYSSFRIFLSTSENQSGIIVIVGPVISSTQK